MLFVDIDGDRASISICRAHQDIIEVHSVLIPGVKAILLHEFFFELHDLDKLLLSLALTQLLNEFYFSILNLLFHFYSLHQVGLNELDIQKSLLVQN